jgi:hypothetical protein
VKKKDIILFILIFIMGIIPRVWEFGAIPAGIHADEAANGVDAYDVLNYRMDRTATILPIQFISWGSGQSAFYAYTAMPFIKIWGLNKVTIRLPNLIAGILILPLIFLAGKKILNTKFGLISMFLMAISPWNIMGSRWGLEAYFVPFLFLLGFTCYLFSEKNNYWFILGTCILVTTFYVYSTTFVVVPIFILLSVLFLWKYKKIGLLSLLLGGILALILSIPMGLFFIVNAYGLKAIRIYKFTIPLLATLPRYQTTVSIFQGKAAAAAILNNLQVFFTLLWSQKDGIIWNSVGLFGFLYPFAIIPATIGFILGLLDYRKTKSPTSLLVFFWLIAALPIGLLQSAKIHRISLLYIPLTFVIAYLIYWMGRKYWIAQNVVVVLYLVGFSIFVSQYFGAEYQTAVNKSVSFDIISAIRYADNYPDYQVCISEKVHQGNIYILFLKTPNPTSYLLKSGYIDSDIPFTKPGEYSKYILFLSACDPSKNTVYLLTRDEPIPANLENIPPVVFDNMIVLVNKK